MHPGTRMGKPSAWETTVRRKCEGAVDVSLCVASFAQPWANLPIPARDTISKKWIVR